MASPVAQQGSRAGLITALVIFVILWIVTTVFYFQEQGRRAKAELDVKAEQEKWVGLIDAPSPAEDPKVVNLKEIVKSEKYRGVNSALGVLERENEVLIRAVGIDPAAVVGPTTAPVASADGSTSSAPVGPRPSEIVFHHVRSGLETFYGILSHGSKQAFLAAGRKMKDGAPVVDAAAIGVITTEGDVIGALEKIAEKYVELARTSSDQITKLDTEAKAEKAAKDKVASEVAGLKQQVADLDGTKQQLAAAEQRVKDIQAEIDKLKTDTKAVSQQELDRLNGEISRLTTELTSAQAMYKKAVDDAQPYKEAVKRFRMDPRDNIVRRSDGRIIRVNNDGTCRIDLGDGDQIARGLTFEVYDGKLGVPGLNADVSKYEDQFHMRGMAAAPADKGAAPAVTGLAAVKRATVDPNKLDTLPIGGKGSIEVIEVGPGKQSLCRIVRAEPGQILKEGDVIANLVYDPATKFKFAIFGAFDMDYDGRSKSQDLATIRRLVEQWGGQAIMPKSAADLVPNTDFLIVGIAPAIVPLGENPTPPEQQAHDQSVAARKAYDEMLERAREYGIPMLNQTRFLYYVGFFDQRLR